MQLGLFDLNEEIAIYKYDDRMNYKFEWIENNLVVTISGDIIFDSLLSGSEKIYGDSRLDNMDYLIVNFLNIDSFKLLDDEIKIIATLDKSASKWNPKLRAAVVTTDTTIRQTVLKYIDLLKEVEWEIEMFSNLNEAKKWCEKK
jgi:hypothetical protein